MTTAPDPNSAPHRTRRTRLLPSLHSKSPQINFWGLHFLCITSVYYLCIIRVLCVGFHRFSQVFAVLKIAYLLHFLEFALLCCFFDRNRQPRKINAFSAFCVLCVLYHWGCMWFCRAYSFFKNNLCTFILPPAAYRVKKLQSLSQDHFVS